MGHSWLMKNWAGLINIYEGKHSCKISGTIFNVTCVALQGDTSLLIPCLPSAALFPFFPTMGKAPQQKYFPKEENAAVPFSWALDMDSLL